MRTLTHLLLLCLLPWLLLAVVGAADNDPVAPHSGQPLIVEFSRIDDLGDALTVPEGWRFLQANADTIDALRERLGVAAQFALIYVDRFGNVLHTDTSKTRRARVARGVREFQRKRDELTARLQQLHDGAVGAAERGRRTKEIEKLQQLLHSGVVGYRVVQSARLRWNALNKAAWERLIDILAREGLQSRRELQQQLRTLARDVSGLPVGQQVQRELRRLKQGFTVRDRRA